MKKVLIFLSLIFSVYTQTKDIINQTIQYEENSVTMTKESIIMKKFKDQIFDISLSNLKLKKDNNETIINELKDKFVLVEKKNNR